VLNIFLRVVEAHLRRSCPGASAQARFGALSCVHRCGASLNRHIHYHCCILDGVFEPLAAGGVKFRRASALTPDAAAMIEQQVRRRVLRWFSRRGLLDPDDARDMLTWDNSGFSLDGCYATVHARPSPLSGSHRSTMSGSSIACRNHSATGAPRCPSPRWSSSTISPP
jgi:hypothetical protein